MKKLSAYLLLLVLLVFSISACGKNDEFTSTSTTEKNIAMQVRADAGNGQVIVDWQMLSAAQYYNIYYIADPTGTTYSSSNKPDTATMKAGYKIANLPSATKTINGLTNGTKYWIAITGYNDTDGESYITSPISAVPTSAVPPTAPANVRANAENAQVTVTWTPVAGAVSYVLCCYYLDTSSSTGITTGFGTTDIPGGLTSSAVAGPITWSAGPDAGYTTTSLDNDRTYYFYVIAKDADDNYSTASFFTYATPSTTPPPFAPVLTSVTEGTYIVDSVSYNTKVMWNVPTTGTAASYNIYIARAKGVTKLTGEKTNVGPAAPLESYATLTSGTYYVVITAVDSSDNESADSNELSVTIP
jgi:hypothetical protein